MRRIFALSGMAALAAVVVLAATPVRSLTSARGGASRQGPSSGLCRLVGVQRWSADLVVLPGPGPDPAMYQEPSGRADFELTREGDALGFRLSVHNVGQVTGADLRIVFPGLTRATAPRVATLYAGPLRPGVSEGELARGSLRAHDLLGPLKGKRLSSLYEALTAGRAVVVVTTQPRPRGEVAGTPVCNLA